jgi:hypothetical protein
MLDDNNRGFEGFPYNEQDYNDIKNFIDNENREIGSVDKYTGKKVSVPKVKKQGEPEAESDERNTALQSLTEWFADNTG